MDRAGLEARPGRYLPTTEEMKQDWQQFNNPLPWVAEELPVQALK